MPYRIPLFQDKYTIEIYLCSISEKIISLTKVRRIKLIVCFQARAEPYYLIWYSLLDDPFYITHEKNAK